MSLYLKFKRRNQTVFLECDGPDVLGDLKQKLCRAVNRDPEDVRFHHDVGGDDTLLDETRTIDQLRLVSDYSVVFAYRVAPEEWEPPEVDDLDKLRRDNAALTPPDQVPSAQSGRLSSSTSRPIST